MHGEQVADGLAGIAIKEVFKNAEKLAELHGCLTSPRGDNFRLRLLQAMEVPLEESAIERLRAESGINEYHRHLNRLLKLELVNMQGADGMRLYLRTLQGEKAINAVREFETRVGHEAAQAVYEASLGPNSIRLFLRIYGDSREPNWETLKVEYTPAEIGRLSLFLPRVIEGISAVDKLNEADLLAYQDDNLVHMQATRARSFYRYLLDLNGLLALDISG